MKTTESTGLPTFFNLEAEPKKNSPLIELTSRVTGRRMLVSTEHVSVVSDDEKNGSTIFYGRVSGCTAVRESYDEVKRLLEEAER